MRGAGISLWIVLLISTATPQLRGGLPDRYQLPTDWLLDASVFVASVTISEQENRVVLENGLIRRVIHTGAWTGTSAFDSLMTGDRLVRAVRPEVLLTLDGDTHRVGGVREQPNHAYLLPEWISELQPSESSWRLVRSEKVSTVERFPWKRVRHHAPDAQWPPAGAGLWLEFQSSDPKLQGVVIRVCYEIYDGIPALSKWIEVENQSSRSVTLDSLTAEQLAIVPHEDPVEYRGVPLSPPQQLHVETDYAFQGMSYKNSAKHSVHWVPDPEFGTQVNYLKQTPCLLQVRPVRGPDQTIASGDRFTSFRVFELVQDSSDRERRGLAQRKLYRRVAPWVTENPLILHIVSTDETIVRRGIDQAAECGFEMVSLSFGSGLNMEDEAPENLAKFKALTEYAMAQGIHLGGYSLLSSRRIGDGNDVVSPPGEKPTHGNCPALASEWGQDYFRKLNQFYDETGFLQFTHDGSYPGDWDTTTRLPLQKGLNDSQWVQWGIITDFYQRLRAKGVYLRIPDYYYLAGANECGMGYREVNWSLPRAEQVIHTRQNIFDGTWEKTPSMGWMFVPLTQYHGGGAAATIEPLNEHVVHYEKMLAANLLAGVQAVYRGHRLYDTEAVRKMVRRMVSLYRTHRNILEADLIHLRRADGQDVDYFLHADPALETPGFLVLFNPLAQAVTKKLRVPLYYTGLRDWAQLQGADKAVVLTELDGRSTMELTVSMPPDSFRWYSISPVTKGARP